MDPYVLIDPCSLLCCEDYIFIIRKDIYVFGVDLLYGLKHILRTWIHGLSAFYDIAYSQLLKNVLKALSGANGYKCRRLFRSLFCRFVFLVELFHSGDL